MHTWHRVTFHLVTPLLTPQEFPQLFYTLIYIHPWANAVAVIEVIVDLSHRLESICSDTTKFFLGDLNHVHLDKALRTYEQYVKCPTTQKNTTLDLCYGNVLKGYKSIFMPGVGPFYHNSIFLVPTYVHASDAWRRRRRLSNSGQRTVLPPYRPVLNVATGNVLLMVVGTMLMI